MARIIKLACRFPKVGQVITKNFENSRVDPATNRTVYFKDIDWEITAKTSTLSNELDNKFYTIYHYDLDSVRIFNKDRKSIDLPELIAGLRDSLVSTFEGHDIKLVVDEANKKEIKKLIDSKIISNANVVSTKIEEKIEINMDPFAGMDELVSEEDNKEITGLADIREKIVNKK